MNDPNTILIASLLIGIILLLIVGAFVFSPSFRKDVIASDGEASVLGMFTVKGVLIILLVAIFCGTFIYIVNISIPDTNPVIVDNKVISSPKTDIKYISNQEYGVYLDSTLKHKISPKLDAKWKRGKSFIGKSDDYIKIEFENTYLVCRIDSVNYYYGKSKNQNQNDTTFIYTVRFGEETKGVPGINWSSKILRVSKTPYGRFTGLDDFEYFSESMWKGTYKVLMALGEPYEDKSRVDFYNIIATCAGLSHKRE